MILISNLKNPDPVFFLATVCFPGFRVFPFFYNIVFSWSTRIPGGDRVSVKVEESVGEIVREEVAVRVRRERGGNRGGGEIVGVRVRLGLYRY